MPRGGDEEGCVPRTEEGYPIPGLIREKRLTARALQSVMCKEDLTIK